MALLQNFYLHLAGAFIVAFIIILFQAQDYKSDPRISDSLSYLSVAQDFADTGVLTDGNFKGISPYEGEQGQGMFFAPLYPALAGLAMKFDPVLQETVRCHLTQKNHAECLDDFGLLRAVHIILAVMAVFFVWLSAYVVTHSFRIAWIAMGLSFLAEAYAYYTAQAMTEVLLFPIFTAFCFFGVAAWRYKKTALWFLCGLLLGLCALTRPSFVYLFYASIPAMIMWFTFNKNIMPKTKVFWVLMFVIGYSVIVGPWVARNGLAIGQYAISKGYASFTLVQRTSFNQMNWQEWGASFIYSLPDFGDSLAVKLFPKEAYERLDYDTQDGFYQQGNGAYRDQVLGKAGSKENELSYIVKNEVIGNAYKHIMVTISLAWRGMWVSKYWGLIAIPIFFSVFIFALHRGWTEFILFALPPWFMLGFHAFTSVNVVRYNLILIPCLAIAVAFLLNVLLSSIKHRMNRRGKILNALEPS